MSTIFPLYLSGDKWVETQNTVRVDELHWDLTFRSFTVLTTTLHRFWYTVRLTSSSLLDYDNPQEKHDERLHTTRILDFFFSRAHASKRTLISRGTLVFARMDIVIDTDKCECKLVEE